MNDHMDPDPRKPWDSAEVVDAFRTTWALFAAIQAKDEERINDILTATDDWVLMHGWDCVAARLLDVLRHHAHAVGCNCGSDEWLESERLHLATLKGKEEQD